MNLLVLNKDHETTLFKMIRSKTTKQTKLNTTTKIEHFIRSFLIKYQFSINFDQTQNFY